MVVGNLELKYDRINFHELADAHDLQLVPIERLHDCQQRLLRQMIQLDMAGIWVNFCEIVGIDGQKRQLQVEFLCGSGNTKMPIGIVREIGGNATVESIVYLNH